MSSESRPGVQGGESGAICSVIQIEALNTRLYSPFRHSRAPYIALIEEQPMSNDTAASSAIAVKPTAAVAEPANDHDEDLAPAQEVKNPFIGEDFTPRWTRHCRMSLMTTSRPAT